MKYWYKYSIAFLIISLGNYACSVRIEEPQFRRIGNFDIKKLGLLQNTISFEVVFYNPNDFTVNVKEAASDIYVDSVFLGKFIQPTPVEVGKNTEFILPLSGAVNLQTVLKMNIKDLINKDVLIRANGSVKVGKAGIFITRPISYQGKHRIDFNLEKIPL